MAGIGGGGLGVDGFPLGLGTEAASDDFVLAANGSSAAALAVNIDHGIVLGPAGSSADVLVASQPNVHLDLASAGASVATLGVTFFRQAVFNPSDGSSVCALEVSVALHIALEASGASVAALTVRRRLAMVLAPAGSSAAALAGSGEGFDVALGPVHAQLRLAWAPSMTKLRFDIVAGATQLEVLTDDGFVRDAPFEIVLGTEIRMVTAKVSAVIWNLNPTPLRGSGPSEPHFAEASVSMRPHTIEVRKGAEYWDYTAIAMDTLKTHEVSPGGEIEAVWELWTSHPETWLPAVDARVLITDIDGSYFGGLTSIPAIERKDDGSCHITVTAVGYVVTADEDGYDDERVWDAFTAGHTIIEESRNEKCPLISTSNTFVIAGGQSISTALQAIGSTPGELWRRICDAGDVGDALDYHVRTDDGGTPKLHLRRRIGEKRIKIPWESCQDVGLQWERSRQKNKVTVRWRDGKVVRQIGSGPTRWLYKDFSSQIDNLDLALQVADQLLAVTSVLNAVSSKPLVVEWPNQIFENDGVTPFPINRLRAGYRVDIVGILPWRPEMTIDDLRIVDLALDHRKHTAALQLGALTRDDLDLAAQYAGRETKKLGAPSSGIIPQYVTPPPGVSTPVETNITSWGAAGVDGTKGKLGWESVADDAAISPIWYGIDGGGEAITPGRKLEIPIEVAMYCVGLRLLANDGADPPGEATIEIIVSHDVFANYPASGLLIDNIAVAGGFTASKDFADVLPAGPGKQVLLNPTDYVTILVSPGATAKFASLALMVRRTEGSSRVVITETPVVTATAARAAGNRTVFTITTDRLCTAQVEYGPDATYRSKSYVTDQGRLVSSISIEGLPVNTHYKVHVWAADGVTDVAVHNMTGDQVV